MTEGGFAGNLRYVALPAALLCVLAGVGWVELVRAVRERFGRAPGVALAAVLAAVAAPFVVSDLGAMRDGARGLRSEAHFYGTLPAAIAKAGGPGASSAAARSSPATSRSRWSPGSSRCTAATSGSTPAAGDRVAARYHQFSRDERFKLQTETTKWVVRRACER